MSDLSSILVATGLACVLSALLTTVVSGLARRFGILLDQPNQRSLHREPTPRVGGLCLWLAVAISLATSGAGIPFEFAVAMLMVAAVSLADDRRAQPISVRLAIQFLGAIVALLNLHPTTWVVVPLAITVVWSANLFNFMDGADGLATTMSVVGFCTLGWLGFGAGHVIGAIALTIAAASLGILLFNFPPARVFLGDTGSVPLGFAAAYLGIWGIRDGVWPVWLPVLVFLPFVLDATCTLLDRIFRREKFWQAHRSHVYQRLVVSGWSHTKLWLAALPIMVSSSLVALMLLRTHESWQIPIFVSICLCLATTYMVIRKRLACPPD